MFFDLLPELKEIPMEEVSENHLTAGYLTAEELPEAARRFGFHEGVVAECMGDRDNYRNSIDVYEDYTFGIVNIVEAHNVFLTSDRVAFFFKQNLFLLVTLRDVDGSTKAAFFSALRRFKPESMTLEKLVYGLLENTITKDALVLSDLEFDISAMEEQVAHGRVRRSFNAEIYNRKKRLVILQNYYEQLIELGEGLQENENEIFPEETLHYFALFTAKAQRLCTTVERLASALNELRAAHQAALDYSMNSIMKAFSVVTIFFLPLTLIVGWYGMNFTHMPELRWEYGYWFVIGLSVLVTSGTLLILRKKKVL